MFLLLKKGNAVQIQGKGGIALTCWNRKGLTK